MNKNQLFVLTSSLLLAGAMAVARGTAGVAQLSLRRKTRTRRRPANLRTRKIV